jgi:dTDP-glucose 4,6-dehydratase
MYDESKRYAEALLTAYHRDLGVETRIVRIFNTYGPRMDPDDGRVVSNFVAQAIRGDPITIYGDGSQTRSFQYIDDLIEGMIRLMASDYAGPVNIGNPNEFTVLELAERVITLSGSPSPIEFRPLPADDPVRRRPDISLAKSLLDWEPRVSLDDGLNMTIASFREVLGLESRQPTIGIPEPSVLA